mmetsp:Transcript_19508/g.29216  ORF Transcript_19508/g.29216 Transcript_19508/m.29216 type:complete len:395 (-) Transcript_19508:630-1814(-)
MTISFSTKYLSVLLLPHVTMAQNATAAPVAATPAPSPSPSVPPSSVPSQAPSLAPSTAPSSVPSPSPSSAASLSPTSAASLSPSTSIQPSEAPSSSPTVSSQPSLSPTKNPSASPTVTASMSPSSKGFYESQKFIETFSYEVLLRPAWSNAIARTFMGTNPNIPSALSSYVPEDGTTTPQSMQSLCEDTLGGTSFGKGSYHCVTDKKKWTQLTNGVPGDASSWYGNMTVACDEIGGHSFGENAQFCAVEGDWSQLHSENMYLDYLEPYGLKKFCEEKKGKMFGDNHFCALEGIYSQFSTKLPGDVGTPQDMKSTCDLIGGYLFDHYCIVEGIWAQLSTKLPGDSSYPLDMRQQCNYLLGHSFGTFCAVKGLYTQFTSMLPGEGGKKSNHGRRMY